MKIGTKYLLAAALGAANTANAFRPVSRTGAASLPAFASGTVTAELPLHAIAWQALATVEFVRRGALKTNAGRAALAVSAASWAGLVALHRQARRADTILGQSLADELGADAATDVAAAPAPTLRQIALPTMGSRRSLRFASNIEYGSAGKRNRLDIWRRDDLPSDGRAPVLLQVHGGGWMVGQKEGQGEPLMTQLTNDGWVCVTINYRLSPRATWPDHIVDVKKALAWVKAHIAAYGGDPDFIAITGGSAGGHLCALAALSPNDPMYQPGFEDADTTVQAAVPFFGVYDFTNRDGTSRADMQEVIEERVFKTKLDDDRDSWDQASPMSRVHADAPPFFVIHGTNDSLVPVEQARSFVEQLRAVSESPVLYAELPLAQHAFEVVTSVRTIHTVRAVQRFLDYVRGGPAETASTGAGRAELSTTAV